ncbi:MAG: TraB/GumN family protein [Alphaproteobacteria bacterium]|nr:TraB/GumN family protein [Alphaproteobacteria bacterium]
MIKNWLCAVLIAASAGAAHADVKPPPTAPPVAEQTAPTPVRPALFVARDEDSAIYLFGTVHVRRPGSDWGGPAAQAALAAADEVWTEMDVSDASQQQVQMLIFNYGMAPPDRPLSSYLNKAEREQLAAAIARFNGSPEMFERMRPWLAGMMLSVMPMMQQGYEADAGVDRAVIAAAGDARQRTFETAEQQIGFFANLSDEAQREMLLDAISEANEDASQMDQMSEAWAHGDLATLETMALDDFRTNYPELFEVLFTRRNNAWVDTLTAELEGSGSDFVAVGAAHLLGDGGLVELLRARGVRVERVE